MNRLVIVGCGRLAEIITNAVVKGMLPDYELVGGYSPHKWTHPDLPHAFQKKTDTENRDK